MVLEPLPLHQFAQIARVSVEDLQLYLDRRLLQAPRRRRGRSGTTAFHQDHLDRLHFIRQALDYGFSLEQIAQFVSTERMMTCKDIHLLTLSQIEALRRGHGSADPTAAALEKLLGTCNGRSGRKDCQILAALTKEDEC